MNQPADKSTRSHCNGCRRETNHLLLHKESTTWFERYGNGTIDGSDDYLLLKCAGCDAVQLRHESFFSETPEPYEPHVLIHPTPISRRAPEWLIGVGWIMGGKDRVAVGKLLKEVYAALQHDMPRLAAMGIRATLERAMIDSVGDNGSIGENVRAFIKAGHVPPAREGLFRDTLVEAGHAAMHRGYTPSKDDLNVLMDLTEWVIQSLYVHPHTAEKVAKAIPKRQAASGRSRSAQS